MAISASLIVHVHLFFIFFLSIDRTVFGCGQLPQGQVSFMKFTVDGTKLPIEMAYTEKATVAALVPMINRNEQMARTVLERQIVTAVEEVLEQEGRNALLPDFVTSQILQQLNITINYTPINCAQASINQMAPVGYMMNMPEGCFVNGGFVTQLCIASSANCNPPDMVMPVTSKYMKFTGELKTSNIIMVNWSRQMKETVFNRVRRRLTSAATTFGTFFSTATIALEQ